MMNSHYAAAFFALLLAVSALAGCGESGDARTAAPLGASVYFISPADGADVTSPLTVKFGIGGIEALLAGTVAGHGGHHYLLIDAKLDDYDSAIPTDEHHMRFEKNETTAQLELTPGKHTLQLVLTDHNDVPHNPVVQSDVITITVQ